MTTYERLKPLIIQQLGIDEADVTEQANFRELGADSLDDVELILAAEEEFGIEITYEESEKVTTVSDAVKMIDELLAR